MVDIRTLEGCGAAVVGVDMARAADAEVDAVRRATFEHGATFLSGQTLNEEEHIAFAQRFGSIVVNRFFPKTEKYPEIAKVEKTEAQRTNIGGGWHTDHSYDQAPAMGSILVARKLPPAGGDTLFASMYAAYDALSEGFKQMLGTLKAHHSAAHVFGEGAYAKSDQAALSGHKTLPEAVHPVVITHPETGRKALYVNPGFTTGIVGWSKEESEALLHFLYAHAAQDRFVHRHAWRAGDVAIWDNRCTWHLALNDYHGHYRLMHRITIDGKPLN